MNAARRTRQTTRPPTTPSPSLWLWALACCAAAWAPAALGKPPKILWLERDLPPALEAGLSAFASASPTLLYASGRGVVIRSTNGGVSWEPILLLTGSASRRPDDDDDFSVEPEDLERFEDSGAVRQLEDNYEEMLQELGDLYGDESAEQLMLDLDDAMRQETIDELLADVDGMLQEGDYDARLGRLLEAGFDEAEARTMAGGHLSVWQLTTDPSLPDALYVAAAQGLYRSLNQGQTWELLLPGTQRRGPGAAVLGVTTAQSGAVILAGTDAGLRRSDDGGRTWAPADAGDLGNNPVRATRCAPAPSPRCVAASARGLYLSDDAGRSWQPVRPNGFSGRDVLWLDLSPAQPNTLWAGTRRGVFTSPDGGASWQPTPLTSPTRQLVVSPTVPNAAAAATDAGALLTDDGGQTWTPANAGLQDLRLRAVGGDPGADDALWVASDAGMFQLIHADRAGLKAEALRRLQAQWADEPSAADVVSAALHYARLDDITTDTTKARLRLSVLAPRVAFRYRYTETRSDRERVIWQYPSTLDPRDATPTLDYIYRQQRQADLRFPQHSWSVMAMWDIGELIHHPLEVAAESNADRLRIQRVRTVKRVLRLISKRRALQVRMATESRPNLNRDVQNRLRLDEYSALLNAYTGGYFLAALAGDPRVDADLPSDASTPPSAAPPSPSADSLAALPCLVTTPCPADPQEPTP